MHTLTIIIIIARTLSVLIWFMISLPLDSQTTDRQEAYIDRLALRTFKSPIGLWRIHLLQVSSRFHLKGPPGLGLHVFA